MKVYAMRMPRTQTLTANREPRPAVGEEVRRYNPALSRSVPANATLYLPKYIAAFGQDIAFWHRPPTRA